MTQLGIDEQYAKRAITKEQAQKIYGLSDEDVEMLEAIDGEQWWLPGADAEL